MSDRRPTLFYNARIHTVDRRRPRASWFTVVGDRFQWIGEGPPPDLRVKTDLGGKTVVPGFIDAHAHFFQTGLDKLFIDLAGATTVAEIGRRLRAVHSGPRTWLFAHSYEEDVLTDVVRLTREHLDEMFPETPVWVNRIDYHSAVANSIALRRLQVPVGIRGLEVDKKGVPNGILRSEAYWHAKTRVARLYPVETKEKAVRSAVNACVERGITGVHALEGGKIFGEEGIVTLLRRLDSIPIDVTLFLQEKNPVLTTRLGFEHLGGCILIDGSIGSYTAALDDEYEGVPGQRGVVYEKPREFGNFVEEAHVLGVQLAFHAIGPRAIQLVLDSYQKALAKAPRHDHRHRIEHFELATNDQILQARDLGLVVSMQPSFEHFWGGPDGMYASRLGERWRRTNRLRTITDTGLHIAGGSDCMVTPPDPLLGMHAAVNHPNDEQRLTVAEALDMVTIHAAYAGLNEKRHGSIESGKEASFVVLDRDPFEVPASEIKDIQVLETWRLGRRCFPTRVTSNGDNPPPEEQA